MALLVVQGSRTFLSLDVREDWRSIPVTNSPRVNSHLSRKESSKRNQTNPSISWRSLKTQPYMNLTERDRYRALRRRMLMQNEMRTLLRREPSIQVLSPVGCIALVNMT
jgi:hypothetical protein